MHANELVAAAALALGAVAAQAQPIDKITVGQTPAADARRAMTMLVDRAGTGARIEARAGGAYGDEAIVAQAVRAPLGELRATVAMVATEKGVATYSRYVLRRENLPEALRLLRTRWPAQVQAGSDEAGVNDLFFVSPLSAAWVHLGTGTEYFGEVVITTHGKLKQVLTAQNRLDDWWPMIHEAITASARPSRTSK